VGKDGEGAEVDALVVKSPLHLRTLVGFERSMWTVVKEGHVILITAHIDDFIIACADRRVLDEFRTALLQRFEGTYEGEVHTYLGCEILRQLDAGKTLLSQKLYAEDVLRTYDYWDCIPALTPMVPGARVTKEQCDPHPEPAFHRRYRGIVGSLGYLVNMTRPDLAWSYSELSKYVQSWQGSYGCCSSCIAIPSCHIRSSYRIRKDKLNCQCYLGLG
jgi:hypothetical protein